MKPRIPLEKEIQAKISQLLDYHHIFHWVQKTQGTYDPRKKVFRKSAMKKGVADICGLLRNGRMFCIEVKRPGGILSDEQYIFLADINRNGGIAFMANNLEIVKEKLGL